MEDNKKVNNFQVLAELYHQVSDLSKIENTNHQQDLILNLHQNTIRTNSVLLMMENLHLNFWLS